jgi:hypothetical protein
MVEVGAKVAITVDNGVGEPPEVGTEPGCAQAVATSARKTPASKRFGDFIGYSHLCFSATHLPYDYTVCS